MFTVYNVDENKFDLVEEPDPSITYTYADYMQWKFEERVELIKGQIYKMSPAPNTRHQIISGNLFFSIKSFLINQKCQLLSAPFDVRLPHKNKKQDEEIITVVQPDLCIICNEEKLDTKGCLGAPDLVVEILSPGNNKKDVRLKHELYEEAGVKEFWLVYPSEENIAVFTLIESKYSGASIYVTGDKITSVAIPGLTIIVKDIFK